MVAVMQKQKKQRRSRRHTTPLALWLMKNDVTYRELEERSGVSRRTIWLLCQDGAKKITLTTALRLAVATRGEVPISTFLPLSEQEAIGKIRGLETTPSTVVA